jgi:hypothetical protein
LLVESAALYAAPRRERVLAAVRALPELARRRVAPPAEQGPLRDPNARDVEDDGEL